MKAGDTVYFSSAAKLVDEGVIQNMEGPFIRVKTARPGEEYLMPGQVFSTKEELRKSKSYRQAYNSQRERIRMGKSITYMAPMDIF